MLKKDYYKVLGVARDAKEKEIKDAYRNLAKKYHPDLNPDDPNAKERFQELGEAYDVVGNERKRKQYDSGNYENDSTSVKPSTYYQDLYSSIFGDIISQLSSPSEYIVKQNERAFDDYVRLYERIEKEAAKLGFSFEEAKKYTDISNRGKISSYEYYSLSNSLRDGLSLLHRKVNAYDEYIKFLDSMEEKFRKYHRTLKTYKDSIKNKRGILTVDEINDSRKSINTELYTLESNARAFDEFQEFYQKVSKELKELYGTVLKNVDEYLDPKNKLKFSREKFWDMERKINSIKLDLEIKRDAALRQLTSELYKKGIDIHNYLSVRNLNKTSVSLGNINTMINSMNLIDQINGDITKYGISIEELLKLRGKSIIDARNRELVAISKAIEDIKKDNANITVSDITAIDFSEKSEAGPSKKAG